MHARFLMASLLAFGLILASATSVLKAQEPSEPLRPNILWITSEDNGQQLGCYGDHFATTPHLDSLAAKGMMYLHAWSNAPVCAPARTTIITGMYPTSLGAQHMFAFRDRMDERYDLSRAIRDTRYSYIRNFFPQRPQGTYLEYMFQTPTTVVWKRMFDEGKLDETQSAFWKTKPSEELYDLAADPHQIRNLAAEAEHAQTLHRLRSELRSWMIRTGDLGLLPEGELWTRADAGAPYKLSKNAESFPIEEIIAVAEQASMARAGDLGELLRYRDSTDPAMAKPHGSLI